MFLGPEETAEDEETMTVEREKYPRLGKGSSDFQAEDETPFVKNVGDSKSKGKHYNIIYIYVCIYSYTHKKSLRGMWWVSHLTSQNESCTGHRTKLLKLFWLVVSIHLKTISQNGNLPQIRVKIRNIWNHHQVFYQPCGNSWTLKSSENDLKSCPPLGGIPSY